MDRRFSFAVFVVLIGAISAQQGDSPRGVQPGRAMDPRPFGAQPKVALIVGIDNYPMDSGFSPLRFAANDAREFSRVLEREGYTVRTLINEQAAGSEIIKKLDDLLKTLNKSEGTVIFAFSGHGGQVKESQYLALPDTRLSILEETGLPLERIRRVLERSAAPRKVMFVDACRSDLAAKGPASAAEAFGELGRSLGIAILNATEPRQVSWEEESTRHGVFMNFLIAGLGGKAASENGLVTFDTLRDYVAREMEKYEKATGRHQRPYQTVDGIGDFYLGGRWNVQRTGVIETFAGRDWQFAGDGMPAVQVPLGRSRGVAADREGNIYATDRANRAVVRIDPTGILHVLAGPDSAPRNRPTIPHVITVDRTGIVYFGEIGKLWKLLPNGDTVLIAGGERPGFSPDGVRAAGAAISTPSGLAVASDGSVIFSDWSNHRVRRVDAQGLLQTVVGDGQGRYAGDGGTARQASLARPEGIAYDGAGNLYIADHGNGRVRKVGSDGRITTVAGPGATDEVGCPIAVAVNGKGELFVADPCGRRIFSVRDGKSTVIAGLGPNHEEPQGVGGPAVAAALDEWALALDAEDRVLISSPDHGYIYRIGSDGKLAIVAGNGYWRASPDGTQARDAFFANLMRVAAGPGGIYVSEFETSRIYRIGPNGAVTRIAGMGVPGYWGENTEARISPLNRPEGLRVRPDGAVVFAETGNHRVREITPDGTLRTIAGTGRAEYSGEDGRAVDASLNAPKAVCLDAAGNVYIADSENNRVRKVTPDGRIHLVAGDGMAGFSGDGGPAERASLNRPAALEMGPDGSLYVAETGSRRVRRIRNGIITTIAGDGKQRYSGDGGPALKASFLWPYELAFGPDGRLYVLDTLAFRVLQIDLSTGLIRAVAGNGQDRTAGDGGPPLEAGLGAPRGMAVDSSGNLYVTGVASNRLRIIRSLAAPQGR